MKTELFASDVEQAPKIQYIDKASEAIFRKGEHALIGISPSNAYYKEENIYKTIKWVNLNFKDYTIFPGQGMSYHNYLSRGYSENEARKKKYKIV